MMKTPVDRRIIRAIVIAVRFELEYAVPLENIEWFVKAQGQTEGEGYRLLGDFYDALNEGKLKGAYLIKVGDSKEVDGILFISPVELTDEQLRTLDVMVRWVKGVSERCHIDARRMVQSIINTLITLWSGEKYYSGVYKFAINNGITSESDLDEVGIRIPSPTKSSKTKEGGE